MTIADHFLRPAMVHGIISSSNATAV